MQKNILITGASDGLGLETARRLVSEGHRVLVHGRNEEKVSGVVAELAGLPGAGPVESVVADLSHLDEVDALADTVIERHQSLDVLINNAGVLKTRDAVTRDGLDVRFMVNTIAPYRLTRRLMPLIGASGRVINLSSAAQAAVNTQALKGEVHLDAMGAYAQSKLALTMWSIALAAEEGAPVVIAVNPGSLLASKMVKEGFGVAGKDLGIGAKILCRASLDESFADKSGQYFDNDSGRFASPHADALNPARVADTIEAIESVLNRLG
ncbi:SDR family NAD(P)-dependent oxidoreductase [Granulosicoccus sp. 3-233]|uniref:SDR family NAD(P)-dependent oxidoreductase n=1 Tax=Granulosicoccus sp. 3-233 TaxID=3417969 RepID=UPI003D331C0B